MFIGIEGIARKVTGAHIGVDGVARRVKKAYVGVDGVARLAWEAGGESGRVRAYLYNGVKLPELPKWDKTAYPCVCITQNGSGVIACHIHQAVVYALTDRVVLTAPYKNYLLSSDGTTWEYQSGSTGTHNATFSPLIWTDTDAYNKDGTELILEASDPVPLWNYNGMELPKLPEWDTTEYQYACIAKLRQGSYIFGASKSAVLISYKEGSGMRCDWEPPSLQSSYIPLYEFNGNTYGDYRWKSLQYEENTCGGGYFNDITMWANYDVVYNGEVIVTASAPQPVYL